MARTLDDARKVFAELSETDRTALLEELVSTIPADEALRRKWLEESERRYARMASGEDPGLTLEEFWSDDEP